MVGGRSTRSGPRGSLRDASSRVWTILVDKRTTDTTLEASQDLDGVRTITGLLVGSIFAYSYIQVLHAQNLPKPNMALTNIGGTYVEDCGPSGSQTTTFNMTVTVVNTGGNGIANLGYDVNGQQITSEGYYVHANTQLPIRAIFTVQACYGTQTPTYTVVLLSEQQRNMGEFRTVTPTSGSRRILRRYFPVIVTRQTFLFG